LLYQPVIVWHAYDPTLKRLNLHITSEQCLVQIDVWGETSSSSNTSSPAVDLHVIPRVYAEVASRLRRSHVQFDVTIDNLQRQTSILC